MNTISTHVKDVELSKGEEFLRDLYKKFLKINEFYYILDCKKYSTSLKGLKIPNKILKNYYRNYIKIPFLSFLVNLKTIIYSKNIFEFYLKRFSEDWSIWPYLKLLKEEKIASIKSDGRVSILNKKILKTIAKPKEKEKIKKILKKKLKIKVREERPIIDLFEKFQVKPQFDQMPLSQSSVIFVVSKILENLPKTGKFLLVGDDDFISVILTLVEPTIECKVVDVDKSLLEYIDELASKFNLKIETDVVDIRKRKKLEEKFIGFLVNPIYTEAGIKEFVKFGKDQLSEDGGVGFLEVGDEAIGNRFLFLQEFFTRNNLIIKEIITKKIYYPWIELYEEDKEILKRLTSVGLNKNIIEKSPRLGASLYIFHYLPRKPERIKFKVPIYGYL